MKDVNRFDSFYDKLKELHKKLPDWRFSQLILNFTSWYYSKYKSDYFYLEEDKFIERINEFIEDTLGSCCVNE